MHRDHHGEHRIHQTFADLTPVAVQNGGVRHQVTHVADQHQRTAFDRQVMAFGRGKGTVAVQGAGKCLVTLADLFGQVAAHQAQPVGIGQHLVIRVDGGDGIFAIHDRGQRGFKADIADPGLVLRTDLRLRIYFNFDQQAIDAQQNCQRIAVPDRACELALIL